jgi:hypothetical protein
VSKIKYLLKQKIKRKFDDSNIVHVYPGNPRFIKLANQLKIQYSKYKRLQGDYLITDFYIFNKNDYYWLLLIFKTQINEKRKQFWHQDLLIQLIKLLKYIFKRNNKAKEVEKYSASQNAYDDKNKFLEIALEIAKDINYSFFLYGYDEDPWNDYHHYIYYFEIKNLGQLSFHSSILFNNVPEFTGKWIGKINEKFPFNLRDVKSKIKKFKEVKK